MKWTHSPETEQYHETYNHPRARVAKTPYGWSAWIWPTNLSEGVRVGYSFYTAAAAKAACKKQLPVHLQ